MLPNEIGPAASLGDIYAPKYRQATLFSFFTHKYDGVAARQFAYGDVKRAFANFLSRIGSERPFVLIGYGQGGLHVLRIAEDYLAPDEALTNRLAAAYIIDQPTPIDFVERQLGGVAVCARPNDVRCIVSYVGFESRFDEEIERARTRSMYWGAEGDLVATRGHELVCINPITWTETTAYAGKEEHLGAASATGIKFGSSPPSFSRSVGAQCVNGVLIVDRPEQKFLRQRGWFGDKWKARDYNLFYFDLRENLSTRLVALAAIRDEEARFLDPIPDSIDLVDSPINPVPN